MLEHPQHLGTLDHSMQREALICVHAHTLLCCHWSLSCSEKHQAMLLFTHLDKNNNRGKEKKSKEAYAIRHHNGRLCSLGQPTSGTVLGSCWVDRSANSQGKVQ